MKKILVTGAGGFIGSHLVEHLVYKGYEVKAFIHYNSESDIKNLKYIDSSILKEIELFYGDITSYESVYKAMENVDIVYNLAALISIPYSYINPESYFQVNLQGLMNILNVSKKLNNIKQIVQMSTSEVYGTPLSTPIKETHILQAQSPYSASKISSEKLAESYFNSFDTPVSIVRVFNTFGPRQSRRAIIPTIITQAINSNEVSLGNTNTLRDFIYVKDTVSALASVIEKNTIGEVYNIGVGKKISIENIVHKVDEFLGKDINILIDDKRIRPQKSEVQMLLCDNSKFSTDTGWVPHYTFDNGLHETISFYQKYKNKSDVSNYYI